ncbi:polysaccharide deacetylase family protein [Planomonospora sp. ID82291]|uniref:polysaccharide deacetylase family protein n=1 Tax=Planomonospora sp. ID82291 TaxID=2738136 RepID=UPI0018C41CEB|nr:polysaccharide deacetylase family protein [Planomonospora sp. ID82291]MBG0813553.1 polysaccharide deacetylase family protein [Planomonospora sp. ID82291]
MKSSTRIVLAGSCALGLLSAPTAAWSAEQKPTATPKPTATAKPAPKPTAKPVPKPVDCTKVKCIALTFDDGPGKYADKLLATLKKHNAKATFFLEGQYVKSRPAFAKLMVAEGHDIGNHSYTHPKFTESSVEQIREELKKTQDVVKKVTGRYPTTIRPPYGLLDDDTKAVATELKMPIVLWNGGSRDWATKNEKAIYDEVLKNAKRDGVILMHDWVAQTVTVMPRLLAELKKQGYHVVAVSSLPGFTALKPAEVFPAGAAEDKDLSADSPTGDPDDFAESPADGN